MNNEILLFHGTGLDFQKPSLSNARYDVDFGKGFYLTENRSMAESWCSRRGSHYLMEFKVNLDGLSVYKFEPNKEWLDFVIGNRDGRFNERYEEYDVLVGPTADDKLFSTIDEYKEGTLTANETIELLNIAGYSNQIVFKNEKALERGLVLINRTQLSEEEAQEARNNSVKDRDVILKKFKDKKVEFAKRRAEKE